MLRLVLCTAFLASLAALSVGCRAEGEIGDVKSHPVNPSF